MLISEPNPCSAAFEIFVRTFWRPLRASRIWLHRLIFFDSASSRRLFAVVAPIPLVGTLMIRDKASLLLGWPTTLR